MDKEGFDRWEEERGRRHAERQARRAERRRSRYEERSTRDRKGRVLHTRVSEPLDDAIREAAGELRVPVSNLVRNVLEDVFEVVENVTDNVGDIVDDVLGDVDRVRTRFSRDLRHRREAPGREQAEIERWEAEAEGRAAGQREGDPAEPEPEPEIERAPFPEIVGWQPLILNGDQGCADCARELGSGDRGFAGLGESGLSGVYLCGACMDARN